MAAYGNLCTEFYDLDKPTAPAEALAFYVERAREAGGRVLEPMCGSGRFLLPMLQAGLTVDGVDSSAAMLDACRGRALRLGLAVCVYQQSLETLVLPHRYTMAFIPSGSIGLITEKGELKRALSRVRSHLEPNGTFLLEIVEEEDDAVSSTELEPRTVWCPDGSSITYSGVALRLRDRGLIRYSSRYEKRQGERVVQTEAEEVTLRIGRAETIASELEACGLKSPKVLGASELPFLAHSGCTLVEAHADA